MNKIFENAYPAARLLIDDKAWKYAVSMCGELPERFHEALASLKSVPNYISELARLEWACHEAGISAVQSRDSIRSAEINSTLRLLDVSWLNLLSLRSSNERVTPVKGKEMIIVWKGPRTGKVHARVASDEDLLVLKMMAENISPEEVAHAGSLSVGAVESAVERGVESGMVITPRSLIRRDPDVFGPVEGADGNFLSADVFTLQWHITQACDLNCLHCYDRSERTPMSLETAFNVLDDFKAFCRDRNVSGQVSLSGGNPLLYPRFGDVYARAADLGFRTGILGNPAPRKHVEEIISIMMPSFFQISLEGLEEENDRVRGRGHFGRTLEFLALLKELGVYTMVMLTMTKDNIDDVIPLALRLEGLADSFNFNRLSMVGEGAGLRLPERERFASFLNEYHNVSRDHPHMRLKDNLFNVVLHKKGMEVFDGCTGFGCGAAFNFITVLSDGEAHACRKFPSPIGNVFEQCIAGVYDSELARRYRLGCSACWGCAVRKVCGGCLAVAHGFGFDVFSERDPFCFID